MKEGSDSGKNWISKNYEEFNKWLNNKTPIINFFSFLLSILSILFTLLAFLIAWFGSENFKTFLTKLRSPLFFTLTIILIVASAMFLFTLGGFKKKQIIRLVLGLSNLLILGLLVGLLLYPSLYKHDIINLALKKDLAFKQEYCFDFEEDKENPLFLAKPANSTTILNTDSKDYAFTGTKSLQCTVDLRESGNKSYGGFRIGDSSNPFTNITYIIAWIYVPEKKGTPPNLIIYAHFILNNDERKMGITGITEQIVPGKWTPIFVATLENFWINDNKSASLSKDWDGKIDRFYITFWSNTNYTGEIYVDNINLFSLNH